jgi:hypothetical protein
MNKLIDLPTIHYISLVETVDRRSNLENWFQKYNITNYVPHLFKRFEEYNYNLVGPNVHLLADHAKGPVTSHLYLLKELYETYDDEYFFIAEDDLSLETIEYWNFTWEDFYKNLPKDWSGVQLTIIREYSDDNYMFEKRRGSDWCIAAYLVKRTYIKHLLDSYYFNDEFNLNTDFIPVAENVLFLNENSEIYCFPLFVEDFYNTKSTYDNSEFLHNIDCHLKSHNNVLNWWKKTGRNLSIGEIMNTTKINHIYEQPQFGENWFTYSNLYKTIVEKFSSNSKFVEVGSWKGKSSAFMAVEIANSNKDIDFYCVDTWEGGPDHQGRDDLHTLYDTFTDNMKSLKDYYIPMRMTSLNAAKQFEDNSLDFVFIDASHEYQDVKNDIIAWLPKVKQGGVLAGHDYYVNSHDFFPGVKQAVNETLNVNELYFTEDCWVYSVKSKINNVSNELIEFSLDTENAQKNYNLAKWYDKQGHTAPALTYYLRASERSEDDLLAYTSLIKGYYCYNLQGSRDHSAKILLQNAISFLPKRPEAYFLLSKFYENQENWQESYIYASIGLDCCDFNSASLPDDINYPGKYGLIFQKAVCGYWWGKGQEARILFQDLIDNYQMEKKYYDIVVENITRLGSGSKEIVFRQYRKDDHFQKLKFKFNDSEKIDENYSQVYQDMFTLFMHNGKRNGTYLEIGSGDPFWLNNTYLLESQFDWKGVGIEYNKYLCDLHSTHRKNPVICQDAHTVNFRELLRSNFDSKCIDYLQLDCEPSESTYRLLESMPFDEYKFAVITYEHDYYVDISRTYRDKSREYLKSKGYELVITNVSPTSWSSFEDWWVHPDLVSRTRIDLIKNVDNSVKKIDDYMLGHMVQQEKSFIPIISKGKNTVWSVDNFYENPDAVREFALKQEYVEGGFGRGFIGRRTEKQFLFPGLKEKFEEIIGMKITEWESHGMNGRFQNAHAGEPLVWHCDSQKWGGMLYLTPDAPYQCGTTLYAHKKTRARSYYDEGWDAAWKDIPGDPHLDGTPFEPVDVLGNVYNRLVIFDASNIHSASEYFGTVMENSRLWQMFFFDT